MSEENTEVTTAEGVQDAEPSAEEMHDLAVAAMEGDESVGGSEASSDEPTSETAEPAVPVEAKKTTDEPQPLKSQYIAQAKRLDRENRDLKARLKAVEGSSVDELRESAKSDPLGAAQKLGLSFEDLLGAYSAKYSSEAVTDSETLPPDVQKRLDRLEKLEGKFGDLEQVVQQAQQTQQQDKQQTLYMREVEKIGKILSASEGKYEIIENFKEEAIPLVIESAAEAYKQTNEVPQWSEIMQLVEEHLSKAQEHRLTQFSKLKKFRKYFPQIEVEVKAPEPKGATLGSPSGDTSIPREPDSEELMRLAVQAMNEA